MAELSISSATSSNMSSVVKDVSIPQKTVDEAGEGEETEWINSNFNKYYGYYKLIPEVKIATDTMSSWTIGDGYIADPETTVILDHISGCGIDTFDDILENQDKISRVGGDSFAEIIRDEDSEILLNLKSLNPANIKIIYDKTGIIRRYEQLNKKGIKKFEPQKIFHLSNKRVVDETHGTSDYEAIEEIIKALNESFHDMKKVLHRYVKPMMKFILDTDDPIKIDALVAKFDTAVNKGENLYIPKGSVEQELISIPANSTLNPLPWREDLKNYFYQVVGIPQILMGGAAEFSESSAKIAYLAFEQTIKERQRYLITQVWQQLGLRIDLAFPASLKNEMLSDENKDMSGGMAGQINFQPNETTAGVGE